MREYATKVGVVLGQKLCNITRVEIPIGVRAKAQKMIGVHIHSWGAAERWSTS